MTELLDENGLKPCVVLGCPSMTKEEFVRDQRNAREFSQWYSMSHYVYFVLLLHHMTQHPDVIAIQVDTWDFKARTVHLFVWHYEDWTNS